MIDPQHMVDAIRDRIDDPERRAILEQIGLDLIEVSVLRLSDPEEADLLLKHLKAQSLLLASTEARVVSDIFMEYVEKAARALVIAGLGAL